MNSIHIIGLEPVLLILMVMMIIGLVIGVN